MTSSSSSSSTLWRKRSGIQLAQPFEQRRLEGSSRMAWNTWPVIMQPKLDGERCRVVWLPNGEPLLLSSTEEPILLLPHINEALKNLNLRLELDGELYVHGMTFEQIHSIVSRTTNPHPDAVSMQFHVFDFVNETMPQIQRTLELARFANNHYNHSSIVRFVPYYLAENFSEVMACYESFLAQNYEGMIVRHLTALYERKRSTKMMKFKPKKKDSYVIVGWKEEIANDGTPKNRLGALTCVSDDGHHFNVSAGLNDELREKLWAIRDTALLGKTAIVHYQALTSGKRVPKFCSKVEVLGLND